MAKSQEKKSETPELKAAPAMAPAKTFGVFDEKGYPVAFYNSHFHDNIPEYAIEISEEQWREFLTENGTRVWDAKTKTIKSAPQKVIPPTIEQVRARRDALLSHCDWTQLPDAPLSQAKKAAYTAYRAELRDMTDGIDLDNFEWPVPPS